MLKHPAVAFMQVTSRLPNWLYCIWQRLCGLAVRTFELPGLEELWQQPWWHWQTQYKISSSLNAALLYSAEALVVEKNNIKLSNLVHYNELDMRNCRTGRTQLDTKDFLVGQE